MPKPDDFQIVEVDVGAPGAGEVLVKNVCMSVDPYMRGRMVDRKSYVPPFQLDATMNGGAIGRVVDSKHPEFRAGDYVESNFGWRESFVAKGDVLSPLGKLVAPASAYLGALGMPGMTAYVGLLEVGALKDGETVFVSGAAGAVGTIVGQIAKIKGCHVVGSAGSAGESASADGRARFRSRVRLSRRRSAGGIARLPRRKDSTCTSTTSAATTCRRRSATCGRSGAYHCAAPSRSTTTPTPPPGPNNLTLAIGLGLTLRGFIVSHFNHLRAQFRRDMESWIGSGADSVSGNANERHRARARRVHRALHRRERRQDGRAIRGVTDMMRIATGAVVLVRFDARGARSARPREPIRSASR